eukprot:16450649-Heterocapsa_arctica.AAC.1
MLTGLRSLGMSSQCRDLRASTRASLIKTVATSLSIPVALRTISEVRRSDEATLVSLHWPESCPWYHDTSLCEISDTARCDGEIVAYAASLLSEQQVQVRKLFRLILIEVREPAKPLASKALLDRI